ncbi:hypothetical protein DFH27DRAFT_606992 [Peziza echinospora]|nr:hypothetical protein DFH27DRAFT_606992 [Peziza echinospora]
MANSQPGDSNENAYPEGVALGDEAIPDIGDLEISSNQALPSYPLQQRGEAPITSEAIHNPQPEPAQLVFDRLLLESQRGYGLSGVDMESITMQPPGARTNQYIVVIGNIPWKNKWQDLKDLVRTITPNVERAEIYSNLVSKRSLGFGFVRIKGLEEALRVRDHLNGFVWNGRALQTQVRNLQYSCPSGLSTSIPRDSPEENPPPATSQGPAHPPPSLPLSQASQPAQQPTRWQPPQTTQHPSQPAFQPQSNAPHHNAPPHPEHLPARHHGNVAPPPVYQPNEGLLDRSRYLYSILTQQTAQNAAAAAFYQRQADHEMQQAGEFRASGRLGAEELEGRAASHREAALQAHSNACHTHALAQQHLAICNQVRYTDNPPSNQIHGAMGTYAPYAPSGFSSYIPAMGHSGGYSGAPLQPPYTATYPASQQVFESMPALDLFTGSIPARNIETIDSSSSYYPGGDVHVPPVPMYFIPPSGLPVNLSHGAVRSELRTVFIGDLPFDTTWRELKQYLRTPLRVEIPRNQNNNRAKGHAFAIFDSFEAAELACRTFDNTVFKGRTIRVRLDRHPPETILPTPQSAEAPAEGRQFLREGHTQVAVQQHHEQISEYRPPIVVDGSTSAN